MPGRKIRDEADAQSCLNAAAESKLYRVDWARSNGVDARSLNAWRVALERRAARAIPAGGGTRFVELVAGAPIQGLTLRIGRAEIDVPANFDAGVLQRLLAVVVAAC